MLELHQSLRKSMNCTVKKEFFTDPDIMLLQKYINCLIYDMGAITASRLEGLYRRSSPLNVYAQAPPLNWLLSSALGSSRFD